MIKKYRKLFLFPFLLAISCVQRNSDLEIRITEQDSGYGYQIVRNRKIVINQPFIPAVYGEKPFKSREEARETAELVAHKIGKYSLPGISVHELDSMKIEY